MSEDLIEQIYDCPFAPDGWPDVLAKLSGIAAGRGGVVFTARNRVFNWISTPTLADVFRAYLEQGWLRRCTRKACLLTQVVPGFLVEADIWTTDELDANPVYKDFFRPRGLGWSAGTAIRLPTGDDIVFSLERDYERGPVERGEIAKLNELLPHLSRSAALAARLELGRLVGAVDALDALGLPAVVVDGQGGIRARNARFAALDTLAGSTNSRVRFVDPAAQKTFERSLSEAPFTASFSVRDVEGMARHVAHVAPLGREGRAMFSAGAALMFFTPVSASDPPSADLVRCLFDLTAAEARVARDLATGQSAEAIASNQGVALTTTRSHIKSILRKTGLRRQAEVVALLSGACRYTAAVREPSGPPTLGHP